MGVYAPDIWIQICFVDGFVSIMLRLEEQCIYLEYQLLFLNVTCWGCSLGRNDDTCLDSQHTCLDKHVINPNILSFALQQHKDGLSDDTIRTTTGALKLIAKTTNLLNPEDVKLFIANANWKNTTRLKAVYSYTCFAKYLHIQWQPPKYKKQERLPFIPTEEEIDTLIAGSTRQMSAVLQMLKETGIRIGELTKLKWQDLDTGRKLINITPEKGSNPRILPISEKLIGMISKIPKRYETIFQPKKTALRAYFCNQRKTLSEQLKNPRLRLIGFHTLRHWKGTMEYHKTKDIIHVKMLLGHKNIQNTMVYINLEQAIFTSKNDEFFASVALNVEEAAKLVQSGFEYVTGEYNDGGKIFRKRK